jgi:hypothetical protein
VITTAFLNHALAAAKHLRNDGLPLVVPPHPLYDLSPDHLRDLAHIAYPLIIQQLTEEEPVQSVLRVNYQRPAKQPVAGKRESE